MFKGAAASLLALFLCTHLAVAQPAPVNCGEAGSNIEIGQCLVREIKRADAELNKVYQQALASTREGDHMPVAEKQKWEAGLRDAQRKWIAFRDADCRGIVPYEWYGGSGASNAVSFCVLEKTQARTKDLTDRYVPK